MKTSIQRWGNSLAVRIPKSFAAELGVTAGSAVDMHVVEDKLVVERASGGPLSLGDLLDRVTSENLHGEVDTGSSEGREVW